MTKVDRILQGWLKGIVHAYRERSDSFWQCLSLVSLVSLLL